MTEQSNTPKVSVLIPTYNGRRFIEQTIRSVLDQTFTDFELLILDDCSTDDTVEVIKRISDPRITLDINKKNIGNGPSRDKLISLARGVYCAMLDHDDLCYPERLQIQVTFLDSHPDIDICSSSLEIIDENDNPTGEFWLQDRETDAEIKANSFYTCSVAQTAMMFRRDRFLQFGCHYPDRQCGADDMAMYATALPHLKFHNLLTPLVRYRSWEGQISANSYKVQQEEAAGSLIKHYENLLGPELTERDKRIIFSYHARPFTKEDLPDFRKLALKVLKANRRKKIHDQEVLCRFFKRLNKHLTRTYIASYRKNAGYAIFKLKCRLVR